jgi:hypothetical protein
LNQPPSDLLDFRVGLASNLLQVHQLHRQALPLPVLREIDLAEGALADLPDDLQLCDFSAVGNALVVLEVVAIVEFQFLGAGLHVILNMNVYDWMAG